MKEQRAKKAKVDSQGEIKSKSYKSDLIMEELPKDMKLVLWRLLPTPELPIFVDD